MTLPKIASLDEWLTVREEYQDRWSRRGTDDIAGGQGNAGGSWLS
jgi:hypothetical protein